MNRPSPRTDPAEGAGRSHGTIGTRVDETACPSGPPYARGFGIVHLLGDAPRLSEMLIFWAPIHFVPRSPSGGSECCSFLNSGCPEEVGDRQGDARGVRSAGRGRRQRVQFDSHAAREHCADCHADHGGKLKSLTAIADSNCTRCHADLKNHAVETPGVALTITDFFSGHPEFKKLQQPPRRKLTFSHSLHLTKGTSYGTKSDRAQKIGDISDKLGGVPEKVGGIPESYRERHRQAGPAFDDHPSSLDCQSCHRMTGSSARSVRGEGLFMEPMTFEHDCKGCHDLKTIAVGDDKFQQALYPQHGVQPEALSDWLTSELTMAVGHDQTKSTDIKLFGGRLDPQVREKIEQDLQPRVKSLVAAAQKQLTGSEGACAKCHEIDGNKIVSPEIPTVWFKKSWFDHASCIEAYQRPVSPLPEVGREGRRNATRRAGAARHPRHRDVPEMSRPDVGGQGRRPRQLRQRSPLTQRRPSAPGPRRRGVRSAAEAVDPRVDQERPVTRSCRS